MLLGSFDWFDCVHRSSEIDWLLIKFQLLISISELISEWIITYFFVDYFFVCFEYMKYYNSSLFDWMKCNEIKYKFKIKSIK